MIKLKEITRDNFHDILALSVFDEQQNFVASNCYSLAQAKANPECVPLAIYDGETETPVGFIMYGMDVDDGEYWVYRLMTDKKFQRKGYGRQAMLELLQLLEILQQSDDPVTVYLSFVPANEVAKKLYESLGFAPDGRIIDGEIVYRLN